MKYAYIIIAIAVTGVILSVFSFGRYYGRMQCQNAVIVDTANHNKKVADVVMRYQTESRIVGIDDIRDWVLSNRARKD